MELNYTFLPFYLWLIWEFLGYNLSEKYSSKECSSASVFATQGENPERISWKDNLHESQFYDASQLKQLTPFEIEKSAIALFSN